MGPLLTARLLELNDTQEGVLNIVFRVADEQGLALLDLKDLRATLQFVADHASELTTSYGNVASSTVGAIQRQLLVLETQRADKFFGEPALAISDFLRTDRDGRGVVNVLAADKADALAEALVRDVPVVDAVGIVRAIARGRRSGKPKLVFFFDEAHLLFRQCAEGADDGDRAGRAPDPLEAGVGVYFVTQNPPDDCLEVILGQLGNRAQHALRAFTPRDQKAVRTAAETFRKNPAFDTAEVIMQLGVGEALLSMLDEKGRPTWSSAR